MRAHTRFTCGTRAVSPRGTGSRLLDDCGAAFDCVVEAVHDQGEGKLIVGRIVSAEFRSKRYEPLIYREEEY